MKNKKQKFEVKDVYQIVTDLIIENLEKGVVAWQMPWKRGIDSFAYNYVSKKAYNGINIFLLGLLNYDVPCYLTVKQANALGGYIKKGEKGFPVVYWSFLYFDENGNKLKSPELATKKVPLLKYYTVFNVAQIEGIEFDLPQIENVENLFNPIEVCENMINAMTNKPTIDYLGGNQAFYSPLRDHISLPKKELFLDHNHYYSTLFHELVHSTGHSKRLNREGIVKPTRFGTDLYSKEELVAEFGNAFLCNIAGIGNYTIENSSAYIQSWIKRFKDDKTLLISAAGKAQKAVEYITKEQGILAEVA